MGVKYTFGRSKRYSASRLRVSEFICVVLSIPVSAGGPTALY